MDKIKLPLKVRKTLRKEARIEAKTLLGKVDEETTKEIYVRLRAEEIEFVRAGGESHVI